MQRTRGDVAWRYRILVSRKFTVPTGRRPIAREMNRLQRQSPLGLVVVIHSAQLAPPTEVWTLVRARGRNRPDRGHGKMRGCGRGRGRRRGWRERYKSSLLHGRFSRPVDPTGEFCDVPEVALELSQGLLGRRGLPGFVHVVHTQPTQRPVGPCFLTL